MNGEHGKCLFPDEAELLMMVRNWDSRTVGGTMFFVLSSLICFLTGVIGYDTYGPICYKDAQKVE